LVLGLVLPAPAPAWRGGILFANHGLMLRDGSTVGERFREGADRLLGTGLLQLTAGGD